jgi:hypothetical protein
MRVEFTETVKIGTQTYEAGDCLSFPDDEAQRYVDLGWAKNPETGEQGERKPGANGPVVPNTVSQAL